jgi:hypothetical protein
MGKKVADRFINENSSSQAEADQKECRVIAGILLNGIHYFMIQEEDDGETTFILENKRGSTIYVNLEYPSKDRLQVYWNGLQGNMHKSELYCIIMDRILLQAFHRGAASMECYFETFGKLPDCFEKAGYSDRPRELPEDLVKALEMYGFVHLPGFKVLVYQLG